MAQEIKPAYVTFEQAKRLKEKGFDGPCTAFYDEEDNSNQIYYYCNANRNVTGDISCWHDDLLAVTNTELDELGAFCYKDEEETESYERLTAPEQHQIVEWLRINHGIWVRVEPDWDGMWWAQIKSNSIPHARIGKWQVITACAPYNSPQEAYSAAFDYVLNNLL